MNSIVRCGRRLSETECRHLYVTTAASCVHKHRNHFEGKRNVGFGLGSAESSVRAHANEEQRRAVGEFALELGLCCGSEVRDELLQNDLSNLPVSAIP